VTHVADLRRVDRGALSAALGANQATHLIALSTGQDDRPVEPEREAKSIGHEETYPHDKHTRAEVDREIVRLADAVALRLRKHHVGARTITLKVRFAGFVTITRSVTTASAIDLAPDILGVLRPVLETIDPTPGIRLLGVSGSNLAAPARQLTLDEALDDEPDWDAATSALDDIRDRFGSAAIGPASALDGDKLHVVERGAQQWGPDADRHRTGQGTD
jgi:DNA polymerase-4